MRNFKGFNLVLSNQFFVEDLALSERSRADLSAGKRLSAWRKHGTGIFTARARLNQISI